ncbi:MAG TPA: ABC transporter permease [Vicinamibacterales bacterium]|nr:ABC transporter permease [Vicinamibacterales bacterium]
MTALAGLLRKEVRHILRDRRTLIVILLMPVVQVLLFGYAVRTDVKNVRLAVVDPLPDDQTLALRHRFAGPGVFTIVAVLHRAGDLDPLFQAGRAQVAVLIEPGFGERLARGLPAQVAVIADTTEPNTGSAVQGDAAAVIQAFAQDLGARAPGARIAIRTRLRFNPTAESSNLFVPGLMAFVLTIIATLMTAISLTREKETGTMEALLVSPLRPWQIVAGKVVPYVAIGFVMVLVVIAEARLLFDVPIRGSLVLLLGEGLLFIVVSLALGMLISARTSSQRVAMLAALVGTMLPTMLLSGFIFPIESMPAILQWVSAAMPARWFVLVARGIMLKGVGVAYLWRPTLILLAMAAGLLTLSTHSFSERLD